MYSLFPALTLSNLAIVDRTAAESLSITAAAGRQTNINK